MTEAPEPQIPNNGSTLLFEALANAASSFYNGDDGPAKILAAKVRNNMNEPELLAALRLASDKVSTMIKRQSEIRKEGAVLAKAIQENGGIMSSEVEHRINELKAEQSSIHIAVSELGSISTVLGTAIIERVKPLLTSEERQALRFDFKPNATGAFASPKNLQLGDPGENPGHPRGR